MILKQIANSFSFWTFYNSNGRMSRLEYFLIFLIIFGAVSLFEITLIRFLFLGETFLYPPPPEFRGIWKRISTSDLIFILLIIHPSGKRLQDINLSQIFVLPLFLPLCLSWLYSLFNVNKFHELIFFASLFMYLFLFLKKGTVGPNKYGPDPLETKDSSK